MSEQIPGTDDNSRRRMAAVSLLHDERKPADRPRFTTVHDAMRAMSPADLVEALKSTTILEALVEERRSGVR